MAKKKFSLINWNISPAMQTALSLITSFISYGITFGISFFLSPYIVKVLGAEANGFSNLAGNFTSYAQLITMALNGMGSRYIAVAYHKGEYEKASRYFTTLFFGDVFLGIIFTLAGGLCVYKLEYLINISPELVNDVKILFLITFFNFILGTVLIPFSCPVTIKNKLYLSYIRDVQSQVARGILIVCLFTFLSPKVFYVSLGAMVSALIAAYYNVVYKIKLIPEVKIKKEYYTPKYLKELISKGIWNSVSSAGTMLLTGLDLIITNLFVDAEMMGVLSIAKTIPGIFTTISNTISQIFYPQILLDYSKNDLKGIVETVKKSTKVIVCFISLGTSFLIIFGYEFYSLWQPTLDARLLQVLSILTCLVTIFVCSGQSTSQVFTVTLHVRQNSLSVIITGVLSTLITLILVKVTNLGVYAVAGVSAVLCIIRAVFYALPKAAEFLNEKKNVFFCTVKNAISSNVSLCVLGYLIKLVLHQRNWAELIITALVFALLGFILNFFVLFNKNEREMLINFAKSRIKR